MKKIFKSTAFIFSITMVVISGCEKAPQLPYYSEGKGITLTTSTTSVAPSPADSNSVALQLNWTSPEYPIDESLTKYVVEIDEAGNNFKTALTRELAGKQDTTFIAKELNSFATSRQWEFGKAYSMEARVIASYPNNNDRKFSNVVAISYTPYLVPPEVTPPASRELYIVGSATVGGWSNPVPVAQKFTMIDTVTYEGYFYLKGEGEYLLLPVNGDWGHKYNVWDASLPGLADGGDFGKDIDGGPNIPGPATTGLYKISVDFQHGKFKVTPADPFGLLYAPGDYQGWSPATAPTLGSLANDQKFSGFISVPAGGSYEFKFTPAPTWDNSFGDGGPGVLSPTGGNLKFPGEGYFYIQANTNNLTWSITPVTAVGIIGSFAGSGWGTDVPMTYFPNENRWKAIITTAEGDQFKFRMNNDWSINFGDNGKGLLVQDGPNIGDAGQNHAVPAGTHNIILYIDTGGYYTYSIE